MMVKDQLKNQKLTVDLSTLEVKIGSKPLSNSIVSLRIILAAFERRRVTKVSKWYGIDSSEIIKSVEQINSRCPVPLIKIEEGKLQIANEWQAFTILPEGLLKQSNSVTMRGRCL